MPKMYMPCATDEISLPLAPPMYSRGAVDHWGKRHGCLHDMKVEEVYL